MKEGTVVRLKSGTYGQVLEVDSNILLVNVMEQDPQNVHQLLLNDNPDNEISISVEEVAAEQPISDLKDRSCHAAAWATIGIRLIASKTRGDVFVTHAVEQSGTMVEIGDDDLDVESTPSTSTDDGMHGYERDGFVVPDDEVEAFTFADPNDPEVRPGGADRVQEMNEAVHAFEDEVPVTNEQKQYRSWMNAYQRRIAINDDEKQFARGTSLTYSRPPLKKARKS
jgi:hypothetical protein